MEQKHCHYTVLCRVPTSLRVCIWHAEYRCDTANRLHKVTKLPLRSRHPGMIRMWCWKTAWPGLRRHCNQIHVQRNQPWSWWRQNCNLHNICMFAGYAECTTVDKRCQPYFDWLWFSTDHLLMYVHDLSIHRLRGNIYLDSVKHAGLKSHSFDCVCCCAHVVVTSQLGFLNLDTMKFSVDQKSPAFIYVDLALLCLHNTHLQDKMTVCWQALRFVAGTSPWQRPSAINICLHISRAVRHGFQSLHTGPCMRNLMSCMHKPMTCIMANVAREMLCKPCMQSVGLLFSSLCYK